MITYGGRLADSIAQMRAGAAMLKKAWEGSVEQEEYEIAMEEAREEERNNGQFGAGA